MANWAADFEFVEDQEGGKFVSAGGSINNLRGLLGRGNVDEATRVYEEAGGSLAGPLLAEAKTASSSTRAAIAEVFSRSRDFASAAKVSELGLRHQDAAAFYEKAGDFASAAAAWQRANEPAKAGAAYERAGRSDLALQLYQQAGANEDLAECLARQGRTMDAALLYRQQGNLHAEVEMLKNVPVMDAQRPAAVKRLAELMAHYGHAAQAVPLLIEAARLHPAAQNDVELRRILIHLLEGLGRTEEAARVKAGLTSAEPAAAAPVMAAADPQAMDSSGDAYAYLKAIPVFAELTIEDMRDLFRIAREATFAAGAVVLEQGVPGPGLVVIVQGSVEVITAGDGAPRLLNTLGAGAYVGEISLIREGPTSARVVARTQLHALLISRERFHHYLYSHDAAALRIYRLFTVNLADRVRVLSAQK